MRFPGGKKFAFTVFDDTDLSTIANVKPVYDLLEQLGMRTTKSVWPIVVGKDPFIPGATCQEPEYRDWVLSLQAKGFEIGSHQASYNSSLRADTERGLKEFRQIFGKYPKTMAAHDSNREGMYWGSSRFSPGLRLAYDAMTKFRKRGYFRGHVEGDPHFWGDLCKERVKYMRSFVYEDINTSKACPAMPYHDPARPYVNFWYASANGSEVKAFTRTIARENVDRLEREGGACIMYTHFACGFVKDGVLNPEWRARMEYIASKGGWFVPVSDLLDFIGEQQGYTTLGLTGRAALEGRFLWERVRAGKPA